MAAAFPPTIWCSLFDVSSPNFSRIPRFVLGLGLVLGLACSSNSNNKPLDSGLDVPTFDFKFGDLPPGCPPMAGNDKNIGATCTKGGNECKGLNLTCTCDGALGIQPPEGTPCFCTSLMFATCDAATTADPNVCGQNATCCGYMNSGSICVPNVCLDGQTCPMF